MATGRQLAAPATPPRGGWGNRARYSVRSGLGDSPGAARAATPRRRAWQPSPDRGPRAGLPGPPGPRVAAAARGLHGQRLPSSLLPHRGWAGRKEGRRRKGAAERVSGPRGERHRHLFARLSPGARAALTAGPPPPSRVGGGPRRASPAPPPAPPSRPRGPPGSAGSPPQYSWAGPARPPGKALGSPGQRSRTARVGAREPAAVCTRPQTRSASQRLLRVYSRQQLPLPRTNTFTQQHAYSFLSLPGT